MARQIALGINIKVNGTQQAINSIGDLEDTIQQLSEELKTVDYGEERFQEIVNDLGTLKAGFRDVNREIEGVDRTQQFELFASSVNGVTGAFLVATSAVQAFGIEGKTSEELQKFQARALALVNVALGIRQVLEAGVKFELLQRTIAEKAALIQTNLLAAAQTAYTAVVGTSTGALKAFRIALATTGIGAAVVLIGTLISKLASAKKETEETSEEFKTLAETQSEAAQAAGGEILKIEQLTRVLKDGNLTLKAKEEAYKELQTLVPELSSLTLEQAESEGRLNQAIEDQIKLIELRATATALEEFLVEQEKRRIANEIQQQQDAQRLQNLGQLLAAEEEYNQAISGGFQGTFEEYLDQQEQYGRILVDNREGIDENTIASEELFEVQTEISEIQARINSRTEENTKSTKEATEADKERLEELKRLTKAFQDVQKAQSQFTLDGEVSVKVLEDANKVIEKQVELLNFRKSVLEEQKTANEILAEDFENLIGGIIIPDEEFKGFRDQFLELFNDINKEGTSAVEQYQQLVDLVKEAGGVEEVRKIIGQESLDILQDYFETNIELTDLLFDYNEKAIPLNETLLNTNLDINNLVKEISTIQQQDLENLERKEVTQQKITELVAQNLFPQQQLTDLSASQLTTVDSITKSLLQQANLYNGIFSVQKQLADLTQKVTNNVKEQEQTLDSDSFNNLRQFIIDNAESVDVIEDTFKKISEGSTNLTEEQIENINTLIDNIKTNNLAENISEIAQNIAQVFTSLSSQISGIVSQQNSLLLEQLAYQEEQTLATIGDATEEARREQEKVREQFARDRFELEKNARVSELQFSLADSIANGAAAIISALTLPPPAGFLLANVIGGITAAQIATINSQIGFVKSKQFIARRGGLLQGDSHENGGIMANGGLVLEGGEAIINRNAVGQFSDILSQISMSTGGRPLTGDDSRIVEEIRKQNQRPIKTYVLDSDIQDTRKINQRLDEISRL